MVVLPSLTFPVEELRKIIGIQYYEERLLCIALLLRSPDISMVYATSMPIDEAVIDYYLTFLPDPADARRRLHLVSVDDPSQRALTSKLLEREDLMNWIAQVAGSDDCYILPFNVTNEERAFGEALGIPVYGPHPDLAHLGSKSGARKVARAAAVPVPEGAEDLKSLEEIERALASLRHRRPRAGSAVIKLNNGFSGQGNAIVDLTSATAPLRDSATVFCASEESWDSFSRKVAAEGAIVEEMIVSAVSSPSVQMRITPAGETEIVSTHDQILGGLDDQVYLGCRFPARSDYRGQIQDAAMRMGAVLAAEGVIGSFGMDFVIVESDGHYESYLSEINLRLGGTTHPFLMARYATRGRYEPSSGHLRVDGRPKYYVATDNLKSDSYVGLSSAPVLQEIQARGLSFDHATRSGAMLHLLGALKGHGKVGTTCVSDTRAGAEELYEAVVAALDDLAE